jgi:hypothetical protein
MTIVVDMAIPRSPKVGLMAEVVTPLTIVMTEEKIGSSKSVPAVDKVKGTATLARGLLIKSWVAEDIGFTMLLGRLWVQRSWPKLLATLKSLDTLRGSTIFGEARMIICIVVWIFWRQKCVAIWQTILVFQS